MNEKLNLETELTSISVPGFEGSLERLVIDAQRGEIDLATVSVAAVTSQYRQSLRSLSERPSSQSVADFLVLAARLIALKANQLIPDGPITIEQSETDENQLFDDPGQRLSEYRLFKAAADALLTEVAEEGARSFLGLVVPDVVPLERLTIPPERLAYAFKAVLERIIEPESLPEAAVHFSVSDKVEFLKRIFHKRSPVKFVDIFVDVGSRLEAVACFLALLELLREGAVDIQQKVSNDEIWIVSNE